MIMEVVVLKQALGVDVSKASLSMCLGQIQGDLSKNFIPGSDVSNDQDGYKSLSKWLKKTSALEAKLRMVCRTCYARVCFTRF